MALNVQHNANIPYLGEITYIKEEVWPYKKDQFSIIHKYTQTEIFWPREVACSKESPCLLQFGSQCDQGIIYDAYEEDLARKRKEPESASDKKKAGVFSIMYPEKIISQPKKNIIPLLLLRVPPLHLKKF